jgi:hypothetical protein
MPDMLAAALRGREPFRFGKLSGEPVTPWNKGRAYARWARGSAARVINGAFHEIGWSGGVIGARSGSPLPDLGLLDPAPAMAMALGEATYIIRSSGTVIAWWLGPEVYGAGPRVAETRWTGEWVEVAVRCNREYGRFTPSVSRHQRRVHQVLTALAAEAAR